MNISKLIFVPKGPDSIKAFINTKSKLQSIVISASSNFIAERILLYLKSISIQAKIIERFEDIKEDEGIIYIALITIHHAFTYNNIIFINEEKIINKKLFLQKTKNKNISSRFHTSNNLENGQFVVHREYGIGIFKGFKKFNSSQGQTECIHIEYADGSFYVPIEHINQVTSYLKTGSQEVVIDSMKHQQWNKRKKTATSRITELALKIIKSASIRKSIKSPIYEIEHLTELISKFNNGFPYTETEDQSLSIADIYKDLSSGKPMDRLICGDVGFGKTEVAMRAVFAVVAGKLCHSNYGQVAFVAPTTLLAKQHYDGLKKRFLDFDINIALLSSSVPTKQQKQIQLELKSGKIDIVIGTHSILSKKISFNNLGLVILDEEQKFGVQQKDELQNKKPNVHIISMSATPIPRTLSSTLSGLKDISLINTPPSNKKPIVTHIIHFSQKIIEGALKYEKQNGGQTIVITPKIKDIDDLIDKFSKIIPKKSIRFLHGKQTIKDKEDVMMALENKQCELIIATTIIATGMDFQNNNTIIINNAEMFGLAQLHQIRGRIGRRGGNANCYLLINERLLKNKDQMSRLKILQNLNHFGAGIEISHMDLEKRGAGNILGKEQSGHIDYIGINLYQELLREEIGRINNSKEHALIPEIDIKKNAIIPDTYISSTRLKIEFYRRLTAISSKEEILDIQAELKDRFGQVPPEMDSFFEIINLKVFCIEKNISKMSLTNKSIFITLTSKTNIDHIALLQYIKENDNIKLHNNDTLKISYEKDISGDEIQEQICAIFNDVTQKTIGKIET